MDKHTVATQTTPTPSVPERGEFEPSMEHKEDEKTQYDDGPITFYNEHSMSLARPIKFNGPISSTVKDSDAS